MVSSLTGRPALFVRKKAKEYGTCKLAEGPDVAGRRVTLIEDVITTGGAVRDATNALRGAGAIVEVVVCAIDRSPAGENPLADVGLEVRPVLTKAQLDAARGLSRLGARPGRARRSAGPVPLALAPWCRRRRLSASKPIGITVNAGSRGSRSRCSRRGTGRARHVAEEVAEQRDRRRPTAPRRPAPEEEPAAVHPGHAGDDGDVGAHERHEPADDQRLAAVLVEERRRSRRSTCA